MDVRPRIYPHLRVRLRPLGDDAGYTMVEAIVVGVIMAIIIGFTLPTLFGGKTAGVMKLTGTVAQSYREGVESFALDHGGRIPCATPSSPGCTGQAVSADWSANALLGPIDNRDGRNNPYMRSGMPKGVAENKVVFNAVNGPNTLPQTTTAKNARALGAVTYYRIDTSTFALRAWVRRRTDLAWEMRCTISNSAQVNPATGQPLYRDNC